jgi:hypothetical protein
MLARGTMERHRIFIHNFQFPATFQQCGRNGITDGNYLAKKVWHGPARCLQFTGAVSDFHGFRLRPQAAFKPSQLI